MITRAKSLRRSERATAFVSALVILLCAHASAAGATARRPAADSAPERRTASACAATWQAASVSADEVARAIELARRGALGEEEFARARAVGYVLVREGRFAEAAELFTALAAQRPRDAASLYGAALATFNAGRAADAEPLARRAADAALSQSPDARNARGSDSTRGAGSDSAPGTSAADALVLLAVVLAVRGDDAGALKAAERAAALDPRNFDAQFTLGRARFGAGDDAGAVNAFRAAVALKPDEPRALFFLATTLEHAGDDAGALAAYKELATRHPRAAEGHMGLGVLLVKRGGSDVDEGLGELGRAVEIDPNLYEARVALGRALVARGRAAEAVPHLQRAAALAPDNPEPHYQLSLAYRRLGRKEDAAAESEAVKRIHESRRASGARQPGTPP
ncbi:MAG TPA: tetratricopeptide repeat protein [Pyrinomonadaceae bacterium]|nr:tetratricopeptide repeat protein [Pyrinomonadaceae bacterium]